MTHNSKVKALAEVVHNILNAEANEWEIEYDLGNTTEYHCSAEGSDSLDESYINVRAELKKKSSVIISDEDRGAKIVAKVSAIFDGSDMSTGVFVYCELHTFDGHCLAADLFDYMEYYEGFLDGKQIKKLAQDVLNCWLMKIGTMKFEV